MSVQYNESLLDFDLDFLHHTANKSVIPEQLTERPDRCRKSVSLTKKKIIATDSLIRKYYEKKEEVDQIERALHTSKDEYKQSCIEFQRFVEKFNSLNQEAKTLRDEKVVLQEKYEHSQNLVSAMQSHANQLQSLVSKKETSIESVTIENKLHKANAKEYEKKLATLQKENELLMRHICLARDIVFRKKKLNKHRKEILLNYNKQYESDDNDSLFGDCSDHETDTENDSSPLACSKEAASLKAKSVKDNNKGEYVSLKEDNEHDSDCSNEQASADTGRGSSLAFSDGEKCFNSPDYFVNHSPVNPDIVASQRRKLVDTATSPIPFVETTHVATSPAEFEYENIQIILSPLSTRDMDDDNDLAISPTELKDSDVADTNHVANTTKVAEVTEVITIPTAENLSILPMIDCEPESDICIDEETTSTSPVIITSDTQPVNMSLNSNETLSETECLELNNSNNIDVDNANDCEIEMILNRMRLHHTLLTPIPNSPSKSTTSKRATSKTSQEVDGNICKEAEIVRKENKILNARLTELAQEILNIKDILRDKRLLADNRQNNTNMVNTRQYSEIGLQTCAKDIVCIPSNSVPPILESIKNASTKVSIPSSTSKLSLELREDKGTNKIHCNITSKPLSITKPKESSENISYNVDKNDVSPRGSNSTTRKYVNNKFKDTSKNVRDKLQFEDMLPVSVTKDRVHIENSVGSVRNGNLPASKINTSNCDIDEYEEAIDEDYLPLSSLLEFDRSESSLEDITQQDIEPVEKQSVKDKQDSVEEFHPKTAKHRKLSKLEKMRKDLLPRSKIKKYSDTRMKKLRLGPKQVPFLPKQISSTDSAASLNDKTVYEKALKVMNELKSKEQSNKIIYSSKIKPIAKGVVHSSARNRDREGKADCNFNKSSSPKKAANKEDNKIEIRNDTEEVLSSKNNLNSPIKNKVTDKEPTQDEIKAVHDKDKVNGTFSKELVIAVVKCDNLSSLLSPPKKLIATRSRTKFIEGINISPKKSSIMETISDRNNETQSLQAEKAPEINSDSNNEVAQQGARKRQKRASVDKPEIQCKRMLRSSTLRQSKEENTLNSHVSSNSEKDFTSGNILDNTGSEGNTGSGLNETPTVNREVSYNDIDMFSCDKDIPAQKPQEEKKEKQISPKESIFCAMLDKFGKQSTKNYSKKLSDSVAASTSKLLQEEIASINELPPNDTKNAMNKLVDTILNWGYKQFMTGFMTYLKDPQRKVELFNKINSPPAPPMTKSEQVLLYIVSQLRVCWSSVDMVDCTLCNIEYMLFKLNRTPEFDAIESMSHFYAVLCRYFKLKSRLRLFMLDAMYCIQFKAVPLIKQCMDVWMHVLPLAHMGIAKSPLVTCMVYLLHFYKCEDRFNRVQEIRNILNKKYFYEITEWNETKIIEMFKNAIIEMRPYPMDKKLLRIALIVIAKRNGPKWCQNNIVKKLILPILESDVSEMVKSFCIALLGPLLKPYPVDMKVHCEIVMNQLLDILKQNPSPSTEEAVFTSLIYMSRHNYTRVLQTLLAWKPRQVSPELECLLRDFVTEKPMKAWKIILSKIQIV